MSPEVDEFTDKEGISKGKPIITVKVTKPSARERGPKKGCLESSLV